MKIAFINVKNCWLVFGPVKERIGLRCCNKCCKSAINAKSNMNSLKFLLKYDKTLVHSQEESAVKQEQGF